MPVLGERLFDEPRLLLVEGKNDFHVISNLCKVRELPENFKICDCDSDDEVLRALGLLLLRTEPPEIIGVVLDSDKPDVMGRWQSIKNNLQGYSYILSQSPDVEGTVVGAIEDRPRLGFWLMPNNTDSGMLEDFCRQLAPADAVDFAEQCVADAKANEFATFKDVHRSKAVIHTYLAWQDEPGKPLGQSITAQALNPHTDIAKTFANWLKRLFGNER